MSLTVSIWDIFKIQTLDIGSFTFQVLASSCRELKPELAPELRCPEAKRGTFSVVVTPYEAERLQFFAWHLAQS